MTGLKYRPARVSVLRSQVFGGQGLNSWPRFFSRKCWRPGSARFRLLRREAVAIGEIGAAWYRRKAQPDSVSVSKQNRIGTFVRIIATAPFEAVESARCGGKRDKPPGCPRRGSRWRSLSEVLDAQGEDRGACRDANQKEGTKQERCTTRQGRANRTDPFRKPVLKESLHDLADGQRGADAHRANHQGRFRIMASR